MFMQDIARFARCAAPVPLHGAAPLTAPATGLVSGTLVETARGWQPVDDLLPGDRLYTLDGGVCPLAGLAHSTLDGPGAELLHVPGGALGNCAEMFLLPGQTLLIDALGRLEDAAFVRVTAALLEGHRGIRRIIPAGPVQIITPAFDDEEAVWVNSGVLVHFAAGSTEDSFFPRIAAAEARALLAPQTLAA